MFTIFLFPVLRGQHEYTEAGDGLRLSPPPPLTLTLNLTPTPTSTSAQHYLIKANFLPDNDKRLFLVRLLTACCLKSPDVLSKTCRYALLLDQEALHIYRFPPLFRANKNTRY